MPKISPEKLLANAIDALRSERATLMSRVSEIDASFARLGILASSGSVKAPAVATTGKRRGRPPGSKNMKAAKPAKPAKLEKPAKKKGMGRTFAVTGDESILTFVRGAGQPNAAEINAHWKKEGRASVANTPITNLVKAGKLKRIVVEGERGARYAIS